MRRDRLSRLRRARSRLTRHDDVAEQSVSSVHTMHVFVRTYERYGWFRMVARNGSGVFTSFFWLEDRRVGIIIYVKGYWEHVCKRGICMHSRVTELLILGER